MFVGLIDVKITHITGTSQINTRAIATPKSALE